MSQNTPYYIGYLTNIFSPNIDRTESGLCLLLSNQRKAVPGVTVENILEGFDECTEKEYTCSWAFFPPIFCLNSQILQFGFIVHFWQQIMYFAYSSFS